MKIIYNKKAFLSVCKFGLMPPIKSADEIEVDVSDEDLLIAAKDMKEIVGECTKRGILYPPIDNLPPDQAVKELVEMFERKGLIAFASDLN